MRKILPFAIIILILTNCGSSNIQLDPPSNNNNGSDSDSSEVCTDTGSKVTTTDMTATVSGEPCDAPSPSSLNEDILLDCGLPEPGRNTSDSSVDFVTIDCGDGDGADSEAYFCSDGIVFREDGGNGVELFDSVTIECVIDGEGNATISDEELIVS